MLGDTVLSCASGRLASPCVGPTRVATLPDLDLRLCGARPRLEFANVASGGGFIAGAAIVAEELGSSKPLEDETDLGLA